jgi:hypothetical protein
MRRFELGRVVGTPGALAKIQEAGQDVQEFLRSHAAGDWGDLGAEDKSANEAALRDGSRLFSKYHTRLGAAIWIITEAVGDDGKRASTCVLLPSEY